MAQYHLECIIEMIPLSFSIHSILIIITAHHFLWQATEKIMPQRKNTSFTLQLFSRSKSEIRADCGIKSKFIISTSPICHECSCMLSLVITVMPRSSDYTDCTHSPLQDAAGSWRYLCPLGFVVTLVSWLEMSISEAFKLYSFYYSPKTAQKAVNWCLLWVGRLSTVCVPVTKNILP